MAPDLRDNCGFALILTILIVSVVTALTLQFNTTMRGHVSAAATLKDEVKLRTMARSGLNYALAVLLQDSLESESDSQHEAWADPLLLSSQFSSLLEEGRSRIRIVDHAGKICINQLVVEDGEYVTQQKNLLTRFLSSEQFNLDSEEVDNLVDAIKDWIDADGEVTRFGAEDPYYQTLDEPYRCGNQPFAFLEELLLVRGVTRELFYGSPEEPGISFYLTAQGDGKININSADPLVLKSLSDQIDEDMVENMLDYRADPENDLKDPSWYQNVPGMSDVKIDGELVTTSSIVFDVVSEAVLDEMRKRIHGTVAREDGSIRILTWRLD